MQMYLVQVRLEKVTDFCFFNVGFRVVPGGKNQIISLCMSLFVRAVVSVL